MLIVTNLQGQTEPLPDINGVEYMEQVNGEYSLSFICFNTKNNQYAYPLVQEESTIELDGHEFRIKQMTEVRDRKEVHAQHIFFDLVDHYQEGTFGGTHTLDEFVQYTLNGTGWTFENVDVTELAFIPNFGEGNVIALIRQICDAFGCEVQIIPGRHLRFAKQIGEDKDEQFRYKHNIKTLKKAVDTNNLKTAIKGYGANGLVVEYHSPNEAIYGIRWAEPIKDDRYTIAKSLLERLKQELVDVPEVSIELELSQLGFEVELGDRVWVIYEPLGIDFQTRVMEIKRYPFTNRSPIVTLSNKKRVFTDILTETKMSIEENRKEYRSKIEQTNDRITLEVEELGGQIAQVNVKADNIELSINNRITQEVAAINIRADGIEANVSNAQSQIASLQIQANSIQSQVTNLDRNVSTQIKQLEDEIELKVDTADFNGNNIISKINLTSTTATIQASKINLRGAVTVLSDITDELGTIYAGNIYGVNIYSAYINISDDVRIGNNLYLGSSSSFSVSKSIVFNNYARIIGGGNAAGGLGFGIEISASDIELSGYLIASGNATFEQDVEIEGDLIFNGSYQWKANSSGSRVYFKRNGVDLFYIDTNYGEIVPL